MCVIRTTLGQRYISTNTERRAGVSAIAELLVQLTVPTAQFFLRQPV